MKVKWPWARCILCLSGFAEEPPQHQRTTEHLIPESIGGILRCDFLCKACNSAFGSGFESKARLAPELRQAVAALGPAVKLLAENMERGAEYMSDFGGGELTRHLKKNGRFGVGRLSDKSIIVEEHDAGQTLRKILQRDRATAREIEKSLEDWASAPPGETIEIARGWIVKKWDHHPSTPSYSEKGVSPLLPMKVAYEFAALILGKAIYRENDTLSKVRSAILHADLAVAEGMVEARVSSRQTPLHGIAMSNGNSGSVIQVRLFGSVAYLVRLGFGIDYPPVIYTHNISTGEDGLRVKN